MQSEMSVGGGKFCNDGSDNLNVNNFIESSKEYHTQINDFQHKSDHCISDRQSVVVFEVAIGICINGDLPSRPG